jgi:hypothetical protein
VLEGRRVLSTLTVTSNLDSFVVGDGTLRGEIAAAQSGDTIVFDRSLDGQTIGLGVFSVTKQLEINKNLTIQGPGAGLLAIQGDGARVFKVDAGANVTISGLTIEGGGGVASWEVPITAGFGNAPDYYDGSGGGILNLGMLTLSGCTVSGNSTGTSLGGIGVALEGGGISNFGTMTLSGCTVTRNSAVWFGTTGYSRGGGIYNDGTMTLSGCTVTGDSAGLAGTNFSRGGGIFNDAQGHLTILSSVVQNNTASDGADICDLGSTKISKDSQVGKVSHK